MDECCRKWYIIYLLARKRMQRVIWICTLVLIAMGLFSTSAFAGTTRPCGEWYIELNTNIPFIGQCIKKIADPDPNEPTAGNAFGRLLGWLMRIAMTAVVIIAFLAILVAGVMIAAGGVKAEWLTSGKWLIVKVILGLLLLWASGIILNLINPNFFKTDSNPGLVLWNHNAF